VKVGDLVRIKGKILLASKKLGVITDLSEPTPMFPFQVASVTYDDGIVEGISVRSLEVISESK
jgi:hypothetical protein